MLDETSAHGIHAESASGPDGNHDGVGSAHIVKPGAITAFWVISCGSTT